MMQNKYGLTAAQLRSDRHAMFMSKVSKAWLRANVIEFEPTSGYNPPEKNHAERAIRTVGETFLAMLSDSSLKNIMLGRRT